MNLANVFTVNTVWLIIGFGGQSIFAARFILQWIQSEREKQSVIPVAFWYCSLFGGLVTLAYAIHKRDPVFIAGQMFGSIIYVRNLYFIHQKKSQDQQAVEAEQIPSLEG